MGIIQNTLEQGLIYAIMALGVLITYSILDFPDLSVDGTFPLGAAVSALMITRGQSPALALLCAMAAGALAGGLTGLIHVKLKVRDLFSGIIMMTALYAVNMHVAAGSLRMGKANVPFFSTKKVQYATIFENNALTDLFPAWLEPYSVLLISLLLVILVKVLLDLFLKTRAGYLLRAVGDNETVVTSLARDKGSVKIMGLMISGALVALSGAVLCQQQHGHGRNRHGAGLGDHRYQSLPPRALCQIHHCGDYRRDCVQGLRGCCHSRGRAGQRYEADYGAAVPDHSGAGRHGEKAGEKACLR